MKTTDCVRLYKSADCGLLFETESPYYSSITVNYNRKQANLSDIQANRSVECHYEWPLLPGL